MAAYALFLSICDLTHLFFINSFLFYLISIYRVIYHCSPQSARSSRLRIRAHPRRTGRAMAARIAKDLRAYPEVFFCFRWLSALHLLAEKAGDRLRELTLGYDLPSKWFRNKVNMSVSFVGRNLFMFYNKAPFDPEVTASTSTYYQGVDFFMQPSVRTLGFSVKLQF